MLVTTNLRKIARYLRDEQREAPKRKYVRGGDSRHESRYVRWWEKIETTDTPPDLQSLG